MDRFKSIIKALLYFAVIPLIGCGIAYLGLFGGFRFIIMPAYFIILYLLIYKKTPVKLRFAARVNLWSSVAVAALSAIVMVISKADLTGAAKYILSAITFPFHPLKHSFMGSIEETVLSSVVSYAVAGFICAVRAKADKKFVRLFLPLILVGASLTLGILAYSNRPAVRYAGHGFKYMNGYSSTDFTDYTVYAESSKLATLDKASSLVIENEEEMPVMDGAEACYPLYSSIAKAVYKDIEKIELNASNERAYAQVNGKIVTFTNTLKGFERLVRKEADLFFGARPSTNQISYAKENGVKLDITPIGKEAFVFFVEKDNPVDSLTTDQIKAIYHGDITNWSKVGGRDEPIVAFQRPENSGSQTMMDYFMGEVELKAPKTYETIGDMGGVVEKVAQYANERGAMGYSFRYFVEELSQEKDVKILKIDGIAPTLENIENGSYPAVVDLCLITRIENDNPRVDQMREFILSDQGQEIVRKSGYAPLGDTEE